MEPTNGTIAGRSVDRREGNLDSIAAGKTRIYQYSIEVVTDRTAIEALQSLNRSK